MIQDAPELDLDIEAIRAAQPAKKVRGGDEIDADIESMRLANTPVSPWTLGFRNLTDEDIETGYSDLMKLRGFREAIVPGAEDVPFGGFGVTVYDAAQVQIGLAKMQTGRATRDDELVVWNWMMDQARTTTSGGTVAELAKSVLTSGLEVLGGAGVAGVGAIAGRKAAQAGLRKFASEWMEKQAQAAIEKRIGEVAVDTGIDLTTAAALKEGAKVAGKGAAVLATTTALQEAVPRAAGAEGGAWTAQAIKNVLGSEMTDEEAQKVADDWHAAIPMLVEKGGGLVDGMIRQSIQMGAEGFGGALGALPVVKQVDMFFGAMFKFAAGKGATGATKLARAAMFGKPGGEVAEEFLAATAEAAIMGDKSILEAALEVAEITPEMLAAFALPGGAVAGGVRLRDMAQRGGPRGVKVPGVGEPQPLATEGGGPNLAAPEASVEGAAPVEALTPEDRDARFAAQTEDAEAFVEATKRATGRDIRVRTVEPQTEEEQDVAAFLRRYNVEPTFVEAEEGVDMEGAPAAFLPRAGRAVIVRGRGDLAGPAVEEAMHTWEAQQPIEKRREYGRALRGLDPKFVDAVAESVKAHPLYANVSPETLQEEMRTNVARFTGGLVMYLDTPQGRADFETLFVNQPGKIRRVLAALYDWIGEKIRALPRSNRALARARLRVARNEQDVVRVAERVREALREIRPAPSVAAPAESPQGASTGAASAETGASVPAEPGSQPGGAFAAQNPRGPRQFTWREYFGKDAPAQQLAPAQQPSAALRKKLSAQPRPGRVTEFLENANLAAAEPELPRAGTVGRPDLNVPLDDFGTRALLRAVDELRKQDQETIPNARVHELARSLYRQDPDGAREMVEDQLARGGQLSSVDTVLATRVMQDLGTRALSAEGDRDDMVDFLRWGNAFRESRSNTARSLQITRGLGIASELALLDVMSMPTRGVRREVRTIHKEAPGILGQRLKKRRSRFLVGQMGKKPAAGDKFAAAYDNQSGRPISQERIDYLQAKLDAIEAQEADRMERAMQALRDAGYDPAQITEKTLLDPNEGWKIRRIVSMAKSNRGDKLGEYLLGAMLSGPYTHIKNTSGNIANLILAGPVQLTAEALANTVVRDPGSAQWGDVKAYMQGFIHALKPAALNALRAFRTESPAFELELIEKGVPLEDARQKLEAFNGPAIKNPILGRGLRSLSLNMLLASDEFFKTIAATAWAHGLAYRQAKGEGLAGDAIALRSAELIDDYTGDLWVEAAYKGRETTFQDAGNDFTEGVLRHVMDMRELVNDISENTIKLPAGTMLLPFVRTPLRVAATAVRRSPAQPFTYLAAPAGRYKHNKRQLVTDMADTMIAMGLMAAVLALLDFEDEEGRPFITGSTPRNKAQRDLWQRLGTPAMSVRVGDTYYSYRNVEPMSTTIGILADALGRAKRTGDPTAAVSGVLSGLAAQSKEKTFLKTLGDLQALAEESGSRTSRALDMFSYSFISVWVPNALKQTARATDPMVREYTQPAEGEGVWYQAAKGLPYDALPIGAIAPEVKHDLWGRPIEKNPGTNMATGFLFRLLNPTPKVGDVDTASKLDLALLNYANRVEAGELGDDERPVYPGAPSKTFTRDGVNHTWSPPEYVEYVRRSGELARARLEPMVNGGSINWQAPDKSDIDAIEREIRAARSRVSRDLWRARGSQ
jgi:hypothetical protein